MCVYTKYSYNTFHIFHDRPLASIPKSILKKW